jgi:hypothetical protein
MDVYVNSPDRSEVATGLIKKHHFETLKSYASERRIHRLSASMGNFAGVVGSLATGRRGSGGEVIGRYAATLFRISNLEKTWEHRRNFSVGLITQT